MGCIRIGVSPIRSPVPQADRVQTAIGESPEEVNVFRTIRLTSALATLISLMCLGAAPAHATWQLYVGGDFGYSIAKEKVRGNADIAALDGNRSPFSGKDDDVSPEMGGTFGVEIPMFEVTPWDLPGDRRLPDWPVRFEVEASGLREYRPATAGLRLVGGNGNTVHSKVKTWMFMNNLWLDVPLRGLYRPISATSGFLFDKPRLPTLKRGLDRLTVYTGVGIGVGHVKAKVDDTDYAGKKDKYDFAYQFGTGFGFQASEYVNLGMGYRFIKLAKLKVKLEDNNERPGKANLSGDIHEVRFQVRIRVFDLPYPWR